MMKSIQPRKFIIPKIPGHLKCSRPQKSRIGYIHRDSQGSLKINQTGWKFTQTYKSKENKERIRLFRKQFDHLWSLTEGHRLFKIKSRAKILGRPAEICCFQNDLQGLQIIKVEFEHENDRFNFNVPKWFGPEITYDKRFRSEELAYNDLNLNTLPSSLNGKKQDLVIGTIPFLVENNQLKVVTVTSRRKGKIIFPKGQPEAKLSVKSVARIEAEEEAGIKGTVASHPFLYPYKSDSIINCLLCPIHVEELHDNWLEKNERERTVYPADELLFRQDLKHLHLPIKILKSHFSSHIGNLTTP